jgi:hypothetical protein
MSLHFDDWRQLVLAIRNGLPGQIHPQPNYELACGCGQPIGLLVRRSVALDVDVDGAVGVRHECGTISCAAAVNRIWYKVIPGVAHGRRSECIVRREPGEYGTTGAAQENAIAGLPAAGYGTPTVDLRNIGVRDDLERDERQHAATMMPCTTSEMTLLLNNRDDPESRAVPCRRRGSTPRQLFTEPLVSRFIGESRRSIRRGSGKRYSNSIGRLTARVSVLTQAGSTDRDLSQFRYSWRVCTGRDSPS